MSTIRMHSLRVFAVLTLASGLGCGAEPERAASTRSYQEPYDTTMPGRIHLTGGRLEAVFPPVDLANVGCSPRGELQSADKRLYSWRLASYTPRRDWGDPFMAVDVVFALPENVRLTARRLDSAFAAYSLMLDSLVGEPPFLVRRQRLQRASVQWDTSGIRLVFDDSAAVRAFLTPGRDWVYLQWCQRDRPGTLIRRPILP